MRELLNQNNWSKHFYGRNRPDDEDLDVQVNEVLDLLAAMMRKKNRIQAGDQGANSEGNEETFSRDFQN